MTTGSQLRANKSCDGRASAIYTLLERLQSYGVDPVGNTPAEFAKTIAADVALWADAVKMTGLDYKP
jgi:hypothetical protein